MVRKYSVTKHDKKTPGQDYSRRAYILLTAEKYCTGNEEGMKHCALKFCALLVYLAVASTKVCALAPPCIET